MKVSSVSPNYSVLIKTTHDSTYVIIMLGVWQGSLGKDMDPGFPTLNQWLKVDSCTIK